MGTSTLRVSLPQSVLIVLLTLYLTGCEQECLASAQLSGQLLFDSAVSSVKTLASRLGNAFDNSCPPSTCPCSQDLCQPLPKNSAPVCFPSNSSKTNLYNCSNLLEQVGTPSCPSVLVTRDKSSVNYVRLDASQKVDLNIDAIGTQQSAVCRTSQLDSVFLSISESYQQYNIYADYYVGTIDGSFRSFPGREDSSTNCGAFDSRRRPWYSGAISYPNHLVILIDRGYSMGNDVTVPTPTSLAGSGLDYAKIFASSLLETVYVGSYVNVFTFGGNRAIAYNDSTPVDFNPSDPQSHPELEDLKIRINSTFKDASNTVPLDFLKALNASFKAFDGANTDMFNRSLALNVILLSDGLFTTDINYSDPSTAAFISQFATRNVTLFIYGMNANPDPALGYDARLTTLRDKSGGFYLNIRGSDFQDPLFSMGSYFGFLAASHKNMYGDSPFWSRNYIDYFGVAQIVTVAEPAFTANNSFVGVAAIDIILDELGPETIKDFKKALDSQRGKQAALSVSSAAVIPETFADTCQYDPQDILCPPGDTGIPFYKRRCCDSKTCPASLDVVAKGGSHSNNTKVGTILGPIIGVLALAIVAAATLIWLRRRRRVRTPPQVVGGPKKQGQSPDRQNEDVWATPM
ncbi:hypothetical protein R1sor_021909 [Riccia sorocarpa]|uniref:VWFA domain-containing protein n=1 Tax=Riccia sorocarpa TaxID=122646 RepID=A0ABD3GJ33_9MARC